MKTQFAAFAAVALIAAVGVFTLAVTSDSFVESSALSVAGPALLGHVTYTVYDENGSIKSYSQSDNTITNSGENCVAEYLFGGDFGCTETAGAAFDTILLGTGTPTATTAHGTSTGVVTPSVTQADLAVGVSQASSGAPPGAGASSAIAVVETTFTGNTATFTEAALMAGSTGDILAYQNMADAVVTTGDSLKVTWTVTIGP